MSSGPLAWQLEFSPKALRQLNKLPQESCVALLVKLRALVDGLSIGQPLPGPPAIKKLKGTEAWRLRVGDHRAIFQVIPGQPRRLLVTTLGHRRDVYD